jgi:hypothetical protein
VARSNDCLVSVPESVSGRGPERWILQPRFDHSTTSKTSRRRQKYVFSGREPNKPRYGRVSCQAVLPEGRSDQPQETNRDEILALGLGSGHRLSLLYPNVQPRCNTIPYLVNHGILFMIALLIWGPFTCSIHRGRLPILDLPSAAQPFNYLNDFRTNKYTSLSSNTMDPPSFEKSQAAASQPLTPAFSALLAQSQKPASQDLAPAYSENDPKSQASSSQPFSTTFASISLHRSDRLRLLKFPQADINALRAVIKSSWPFGIQKEQKYGGSYEYVYFRNL